MTYKMNRGESLAPSFEYQARNIRLDGKFSYSTSTSDYDPLGKKGSAIGFITPTESQGNFSMQRDDVIHQDWDIRKVSGGDWGAPDSFVFSGTPTDRKSVVSGKSVEVRVNLGGG